MGKVTCEIKYSENLVIAENLSLELISEVEKLPQVEKVCYEAGDL